MGAEDLDALGQSRPHDRDGLHLHRADIDHQRSRPEMRGYPGHDRGQAGNRNGEDDDRAASHRRQVRPHGTVGLDIGLGRARVVDAQRHMGREVSGHQTTEGAEADDSDDRAELNGLGD